MKSIRRIFGIETWEETMARLPREMSPEEERFIISVIDGFIAGTCGRYDWDWMITAPKKSQEGEMIGCFCSSLDSVYPSKKKGMFCSESGVRKLGELSEILRRKGTDTRTQDVFDFIESYKKMAEPSEEGNAC